MKIKILIIILLIFGQVASASNVTINSNKNIILDGVEVYPISMANICSYYYDADGSGDGGGHGLGTCAQSFDKMNNFTIAFQLLDVLYSNYAKQVVSDSKNHSMYWSAQNNIAGSTFSTLFLNDPYFGGWWLFPEEPYTEEMLTNTRAAYDQMKTYDPYHPISLPSFEYAIGSNTVASAADIIVFDAYTYKTNYAYTTAFYEDGDINKRDYNLTEFIYAWERNINQKFGRSFNDLPDPVHIHFSAYGDEWTEGPINWKLQTKEMIRASSYFAIVIGANGISYWGNKIWPDHPVQTHGLAVNDTRAAYYNNLAGELTSSSIQQILLLPNLNSSWNGAITWDNKVRFSNNPTRKIFQWVENVNRNQLAYTWKYNSTTHKYYLIAVNKYNTPLLTNINISGLSGTFNVITLGTEPSGSSRFGRHLTAINGTFSDTFDAYAAHVYEISSTTVGKIYPRYDVNENGIVDMNDMDLVAKHLNEIVSSPYPRYDVNMDGRVNILDLTIVGKHYGETT